MLLDRILCCVAYKRIECRVEAKWGKTFSNCIYSDQHFFPKEDYLCEFSWIYSYIWLWLVKWKSALRSLVKWGGFYSFFLVFHLKCRWNVLHKGLLFNSVPANNKSAKDATCGRNTHNFLFISLHSPVLSLLFFFFKCIAVFQRVSCPQSHEFKKNKVWDIVPTQTIYLEVLHED